MIRVVKLTVAEEQIDTFMTIFNEAKQGVRDYNGCTGLELWQSKNDPCVVFTYSFWEDESYLETYRDSEFFIGVWRQLKPLFSAKAEAWSVDSLIQL